MLDCYQSAGVVPFDVTALDVDFACRRQRQVAVRRARRRLAVRAARSRGAARADVRRLAGARAAVRVRAGARVRRRARGASSPARRTCPALYAATAGYDVIEEVGVERIRERSLALTQLLIDLLDAAGFEIGSPARAGAPRRHGARLARPTTPPCTRSSASAGSSATSVPTPGVRLGPHFFNSEDELRHTVEQLAEIVESGAYARHPGAAARF